MLISENDLISHVSSFISKRSDTNGVRGRRGCDRMVIGFLTTYATNAYRHKGCEFESRSDEVYSIQHYMIKLVSDLRKVRWFLRELVSSTNKTDLHDITEILLKVALNTITIANGVI